MICLGKKLMPFGLPTQAAKKLSQALLCSRSHLKQQLCFRKVSASTFVVIPEHLRRGTQHADVSHALSMIIDSSESHAAGFKFRCFLHNRGRGHAASVVVGSQDMNPTRLLWSVDNDIDFKSQCERMGKSESNVLGIPYTCASGRGFPSPPNQNRHVL